MEMDLDNMPNPRIMIIGYGRHGKDTVADILQTHYGLTFRGSSEFCAENVIFPVLKDRYGYKTVAECFEDRSNHRKEWYDLISEYCDMDPTRLSREIFDQSDIYCGLRNKREFHAARNAGIFDISIWVDRSDHLPPEDKSSNNLEQWMADFTIDNNGTLDDLIINVRSFMDNLLGRDTEVLTIDTSKPSHLTLVTD
jgi:hypothetical protein